MLKKLLPVGILFAAVLAGCTGPITPEQDGIRAYPQIELTEYRLQNDIRLQPPIMNRVGNGQQLKVVVPVRTHTDWDLSIDYQYAFVDANGVVTEQWSGWQNVVIPKKSDLPIEFTSLGAVDNFRMRLRYAK